MNYANIEKASSVDFEGWSTVLQVTGCIHGCLGCFNSQYWSPKTGQPYTEETEQEILKELEKPFIRNLVIQGGDPLYKKNIETIAKLCKKVFGKKRVVVFTGYTYEQTKSYDILNYIDILVDGKFVKSLHDPNLTFKGSSNQEIIDVKKSLVKGAKVLYSLSTG